MAGSTRNVSVKFTAEISNFKSAMQAAESATLKAATASQAAGKAADKSAEEIQKQALAHHAAAKAAGLQYDNTGQLVTMNGKAVSSQQAATHGLQTFSAEAYLAGRAAVSAGEDAQAAAAVAADAQAAAAEAAAEHASALEEVATTAGLSGAAVLAGVGLSVKAYADFDKQMSVVDSATHETAGNMDLLRQAAIDAGADTAFSAVDAARGIEEMAKAGVTTADILGGGLKGTLALAAAGALDVGDASEIAASAMVQFGLKGKDIPHIADLLAAAAGKAQGSVQDMGLALSYAGVPAAGLGISIEQTTGTLAMFAKAGIVGEKAGTALRAMLVSMVKPADVTQKKMDNLGISFSDASGEFIGLDGAGAVLQERLGGLDEMTRNATLAQIFGNEALGAAQTLYNNGAEGVREMTAAVDEYGYATDTANRMQNNLAGDLEKLGGSFDTVLIQSGSGASEVLRGLVKGLNGLVDVVGSIPAPTLSVGLGLAGAAGGALVLGSGLVALNAKIASTSAALALLAPAGTKAGAALAMAGTAATLAAVAAGLGVATFALAKWAESDYMSKIDTGMDRVTDSLAKVSANGPSAGSALDEIFKDRDGGDLINTVTGLESAIKRTFNRDGGQQFNDWGEAVVNGMTGVKGSSQILGESFERLDKGLADLVSGGKGDDAAKSFERIKKAAADQDVSVEELAKKFPQYADALKAAEAASKTAAAEGRNLDGSLTDAGAAAEAAAAQTEEIEKALEEVGISAQGTIVDLAKFTEALLAAGLIQLSARDAARNWSQALLDMGLQADGTGGQIGSLGTAFDNTTEQGIKNQAMFDGVAQAGIRNAEAMAAAGVSNEELQGNLEGTYNGLLAAAGQFGITGAEAETLARKVLGVPDGVSIATWMSDEAKRMAEGTKGAIDNIPTSKTVDIYVNTHESIKTRTEAGTAALNAAQNGGATGGRVSDIMGFAGGGKVPGRAPSNLRLDNMLGLVNGKPIAVQSQEWIINGRSSKEYDRELAAINAGTFPKMPGYANGGRAGREYSAQSLGYAPFRSSPPSREGMHIDKVEINEQTDPRATFAEFARRTHALGA